LTIIFEPHQLEGQFRALKMRLFA